MSKSIRQDAGGTFSDAVKLVKGLFSKDGMQRKDARRQLEKYGHYATPFLVGVLRSKNVDARWEAAKALVTIKDPLAADALTDTLMDEDFEIRWLAAEALIALGKDAIEPLLKKLLSHYDSAFLRIGAHHIMESLKKDSSLDKETAEVLDELWAFAPLEPYPLVVKDALETLRRRKKREQRTSIHRMSPANRGQNI